MGFISQLHLHHLSKGNQRAIPGLSELDRWSRPACNKIKQPMGEVLSESEVEGWLEKKLELAAELEVEEMQPKYEDAWQAAGEAAQAHFEKVTGAEDRLHTSDLLKLAEAAAGTAAALTSDVSEIETGGVTESEYNTPRLPVPPLPRLPHIALSARLLPVPFLTRRLAG